jgi:hypothetical protein
LERRLVRDDGILAEGSRRRNQRLSRARREVRESIDAVA